jgi:outer membrane protein assembly factor BamB
MKAGKQSSARFFFLLLFVFTSFFGFGAEWAQYRGSSRDGISYDRLNKQWAGSVTNALWRVPVTNSLTSITVSGGRLFTQTLRTGQERCLALNITNGVELWSRVVDAGSYPDGGVGTDDGPRSTPVVDGDSVYVLSSYLKLHRLNLINGVPVWSKDLRTIYGGTVIDWQNAASPVVENGLIYVNANCGPSTLMALRTSDGSAAWRSQNEAMTHSTPTLATIHGVRQVIFATQSGLVSLNPTNGVLLWKFNYPFNYSTSLSVSPVVHEGMVFVCGAHSYGMGSVVRRIDLTNNIWTTTQLWATNNPACHWMTPIVREGFLFGHFGIQSFDSPTAQLKCIEMRTGVVKWTASNFGRCATILMDDHLVSLTEKGILVLSKPDTNAYTELARFTAIPNYHGTTNKCWNAPAVSDGRIYVRSTAFVAAFDFSVPGFKIDSPQIIGPGQLSLTARTMDGTPVDSNRLSNLEVRATTNLGENPAQWSRLTNSFDLTNGVVRVNLNNLQPPSRWFFMLSESE